MSATGKRRATRSGKTKADLIDAVHRRHGGITKAEAAEIVDKIFDTVKTSLLGGRAVKIKNFGTFEVTDRPGRRGVNPANGERIFIPQHRGLSFRPSRQLKDLVAPLPRASAIDD